MPTLDEITQQLETLKTKLEEDVKNLEKSIATRKTEIINLETQLTQIVKTKQLEVTETAQIAGRNIITDGQTVDKHEERLNNHDQTLFQLQTQISQLQTQLSTVDTNANTAQATANNAVSKADTAQSTANDAVNRANNAQGTADNAVNKADTAQGTATTALTLAQQLDSRTSGLKGSSGSVTRIATTNGDYMAFFDNGSIVIYGNKGNVRWAAP